MKRLLIEGRTLQEHWLRVQHDPDARYLWWPIRLRWGGMWHWFGWHGIESLVADRNGKYQAFAQVYHLGKLKIVLGWYK